MPVHDAMAVIMVLLMGVVAALYAGVGHGGASGYLAIMAIFAIAPSVMRPSALVLNVVVSAIATIAFARRGTVRWSVLLPFAAASVPAAFLGGMRTLPEPAFRWVVAVALLLAAVRLMAPERPRPPRPLPVPVALSIGAAIGLLSGLVGVGGGVFLTPLLVLCAWATPREAAAVSAPFILLNSVSGLAGMMTQGVSGAPWLAWAVPAVAVGGWAGSAWGAGPASQVALRRLLGAVLAVSAMKFLLL